MFACKGLSDSEVQASREAHGKNSLTPQETETFFEKLIENFKDPMIMILIVALVIVGALSIFGFSEWYEGVGIAVAVALAAFVSTASEYKNEQTFQKLQEEASRIWINVFRNGSLTSIFIDDVVVGDIILLQPGDKISADGHIEEGKIWANQAVLSGESVPISKTPGNFDDSHLSHPHSVFRGTIIEDGEAIMKVARVGDKTQLGLLASSLKTEDRLGPLRVKLSALAEAIARFGYIGASFIAVTFLFKSIYLDNAGDTAAMVAYFSNWQQFLLDVVTALILSVIIIVVAVPEGLPMMIAIVLAQNMRKLLKSNVLVRQLLGVETSGSLNLLFTDKTGTITRGQLEAVGFMMPRPEPDGTTLVQFDRFEDMPDATARLLDVSLRENTSCVVNCEAEKTSDRILGGNSTERALLRFIHADVSACIEKIGKTLGQVLFNSSRKFSASRVLLASGPEITLVKGAPEKIILACTTYYAPDGAIHPLTETVTGALIDGMDEKSDAGYRMVAFATSQSPLSDDLDALPENMTLLGISLIRDELRPESRPAIETLRNAGIHVVMITGDRIGTAKAIARDAGLYTDDPDQVISSGDMESMSDEALSERMDRIQVVARCLPQDKTRLVRVAQNKGLVVGMTGDGVNDSPALVNADIGFGLGSGTEEHFTVSHPSAPISCPRQRG